MELEAENGTRIPIQKDSKTEVGRGLGLGSGPAAAPADRTVSRRHLSLRLIGPSGDEVDGGDSSEEPRISFEVIGKNPILVYSSSGGDKRVYRNSEKGELGAGDRFSLSLKNPSFFIFGRKGEGGKAAGVEKRVLDAVERREKRTLERRKEKERTATVQAPGDEGDEEDTNGGLELELGSMDVSHIDPVREFGFLVSGHEFDHYPKQKIRPIGDWNWFLEDPRGVSDDDDEATSSKGMVKRRKKKRGGDSEDENWSGESEEEKVMVAKVGNAKIPKYSTRSKGAIKQHNDASSGRHSALMKDAKTRNDEVMEEDEENETLGGFIVDDEEEEEEEEVQVEDWEEEEDEEEEYDND